MAPPVRVALSKRAVVGVSIASVWTHPAELPLRKQLGNRVVMTSAGNWMHTIKVCRSYSGASLRILRRRRYTQFRIPLCLGFLRLFPSFLGRRSFCRYSSSGVQVLRIQRLLLLDHREPERWPHRERFFKRGVGPTDWLMVVVDFGDDPARIVTAFGYGHGRTPEGWTP